MKALNLNLTFIFAAIVALISSPKAFSETSDSLVYENDSMFTIESYKDELSNDGEWMKIEKDQVDPEGVTGTNAEYDDDINYEYVWRPYGVGPDWSPYTNGYWAYTNCGWMWLSYYSWGWRTYHYGRWWWSPVWGWVWSPGFIWAPAWVVWMFYGDYYGWYPISPRIRWHHGYGWQCHHMRFHVRHWTFVHNSHYTSPINVTVIVDPPGNKNIIDKARFVNNMNIENGTVINKGPEVKEIEKSIGQKIKQENVTKYNNAKIIADKERAVNEKKYENEKRYYNENQKNNEKQSGNEKEKYNNNNGERNKQNEGGKKAQEKNYDGEKQKNNEKKSYNNDGVKKEKTYQQPKNYDAPEKKQNYDKPRDNNSGQEKQSYERPRNDNDGNNDSKNTDSQPKNDASKDKSNGSDGGNGNNGKDNGKQKGNN